MIGLSRKTYFKGRDHSGKRMRNESPVDMAVLTGAEQLLNYVAMSEAIGLSISVMVWVKLKTNI